MTRTRPKKFYREATTAPAGDAFTVELDGRTLRTPGKASLSVPHIAIAERIAAEWNAQGDDIRPETMPVTRLANVACDRTPNARDELISEIRAYASTDLLSYRQDAPTEFVARQSAGFDPILEWAGHHGLGFRTTTGLVAIDQDPLTLDRVAVHAGAYDDFGLTLFAHLTATLGSAILALALLQGRITADRALDLSRLDETFQIERWGEDAEAAARAETIRADTLAMAAAIDHLDIPPLAFG